MFKRLLRTGGVYPHYASRALNELIIIAYYALFHYANKTPCMKPDADDVIVATDLLPFQSLVILLQDPQHESLLSLSGALQLPQAGHHVLQEPLTAARHVERNSAVHQEERLLSSIQRYEPHQHQQPALSKKNRKHILLGPDLKRLVEFDQLFRT